MPRATDFHRVAAKFFQRWAGTAGFSKGKGSSRWENAVEPNLQLSIWLQQDKWGWTAKEGGQFTLNFSLVNDQGRSQRLDNGSRYCDLLRWQAVVDGEYPDAPAGSTYRSMVFRSTAEASDEAAFQACYQAVAKKIPSLRGTHSSLVETHDVWMPYYELADVERWCGEFLVPRMDRMMEARLHGRPVQLPADLQEHPVPGLSCSSAGVLTTVSLPHHSASLLIKVIDQGKFVLLRGADGLMLILGSTGRRRGRISSAQHVVIWNVGSGSRNLVALLSGKPTSEPVPLTEFVGLVEVDSGVRIRLT